MYAPPLSTDAGALNSRPVNPPALRRTIKASANASADAFRPKRSKPFRCRSFEPPHTSRSPALPFVRLRSVLIGKRADRAAPCLRVVGLAPHISAVIHGDAVRIPFEMKVSVPKNAVRRIGKCCAGFPAAPAIRRPPNIQFSAGVGKVRPFADRQAVLTVRRRKHKVIRITLISNGAFEVEQQCAANNSSAAKTISKIFTLRERRRRADV